MVGELEYSALFPAAVASFTASTVSGRLGLSNFHYILETEMSVSFPLLLQMALLGILFGIAGSCFAQGIRLARLRLTFLFEGHPYRKVVLMGIVLAAVMLLVHGGRYAGSGENLVELGFSGGGIYWYDWILKALLTILTLSSGFIGGEVAPLFAIGTCLGSLLAPLFGLPAEFVMALGYAAVFGSGTNTLLASILIGCEVFGYGMLPYFLSPASWPTSLIGISLSLLLSRRAWSIICGIYRGGAGFKLLFPVLHVKMIHRAAGRQ